MTFAAAVCAVIGCASQQGEALRPQLKARKATSVAEWEGGEARLRDATMRMGIILPDGADATGFPIKLRAPGEEQKESFEFIKDGGAGDRTRIGAGVPITADGYFLTAKHCLGARTPAVFLYDRKTEKVIKSVAQVVWTSDDEADLALLRTSHRISEPFDLADVQTASKGDRVGATGWSGLGEGGVFDGMGAGRIRAIEERRNRGRVWYEVEHDAPIHPGDSGGPLIDARGRLVGIHSGGKVGAISIYRPKPEGAPLRGFQAISNLPDASWLMGEIEADRGRAAASR